MPIKKVPQPKKAPADLTRVLFLSGVILVWVFVGMSALASKFKGVSLAGVHRPSPYSVGGVRAGLGSPKLPTLQFSSQRPRPDFGPARSPASRELRVEPISSDDAVEGDLERSSQ